MMHGPGRRTHGHIGRRVLWPARNSSARSALVVMPPRRRPSGSQGSELRPQRLDAATVSEIEDRRVR